MLRNTSELGVGRGGETAGSHIKERKVRKSVLILKEEMRVTWNTMLVFCPLDPIPNST